MRRNKSWGGGGKRSLRRRGHKRSCVKQDDWSSVTWSSYLQAAPTAARHRKGGPSRGRSDTYSRGYRPVQRDHTRLCCSQICRAPKCCEVKTFSLPRGCCIWPSSRWSRTLSRLWRLDTAGCSTPGRQSRRLEDTVHQSVLHGGFSQGGRFLTMLLPHLVPVGTMPRSAG